VVYVATRHPNHHEHACLALEAGKHVLVEKPFTLTPEQAREVVAVARARDLFCMEALWMRMHPLIRRALASVAAGEIGEPRSVHASLCYPIAFDPTHRLFDPAAGGGVTLDLAIYPVHLATMVLGAPDAVNAAAVLAPTGVEDTVDLRLTYRDGRAAVLSASTRSDDPFGGVITGTHGKIVIDAPMQVPATITINAGSGPHMRFQAHLPGAGYGPQISEVESCIQAGITESPLAPLDDTIAVLALLDDALRQIGVRYPAESHMATGPG
jgi:predicted dehydrogenase